jgi:predicted amidohydrolase YtcJ
MKRLAADAIFVGGSILTLDAQERALQALAVVHGRIAAVGTTREIRALA